MITGLTVFLCVRRRQKKKRWEREDYANQGQTARSPLDYAHLFSDSSSTTTTHNNSVPVIRPPLPPPPKIVINDGRASVASVAAAAIATQSIDSAISVAENTGPTVPKKCKSMPQLKEKNSLSSITMAEINMNKPLPDLPPSAVWEVTSAAVTAATEASSTSASPPPRPHRSSTISGVFGKNGAIPIGISEPGQVRTQKSRPRTKTAPPISNPRPKPRKKRSLDHTRQGSHDYVSSYSSGGEGSSSTTPTTVTPISASTPTPPLLPPPPPPPPPHMPLPPPPPIPVHHGHHHRPEPPALLMGGNSANSSLTSSPTTPVWPPPAYESPSSAAAQPATAHSLPEYPGTRYNTATEAEDGADAEKEECGGSRARFRPSLREQRPHIATMPSKSSLVSVYNATIQPSESTPTTTVTTISSLPPTLPPLLGTIMSSTIETPTEAAELDSNHQQQQAHHHNSKNSLSISPGAGVSSISSSSGNPNLFLLGTGGLDALGGLGGDWFPEFELDGSRWASTSFLSAPTSATATTAASRGDSIRTLLGRRDDNSITTNTATTTGPYAHTHTHTVTPSNASSCYSTAAAGGGGYGATNFLGVGAGNPPRRPPRPDAAELSAEPRRPPELDGLEIRWL